jgi:4'-phosphopantetheinyl transferase
MRWLAAGEPQLPRGRGWLSEREARRLDAIRFTKRHTEFLLRRRAGKLAVAAALGLHTDDATLAAVEVLNRLTGAPYVEIGGDRAPLDLSLTDRAGWAVALVGSEGTLAAGTVGVDLEIAEERSDGFVRDFLTPAEQAYVRGQATAEDRHAAANLVWSAKESALKVLRVGLRADTRTVEVTVHHPSRTDGWGTLTVTHRDGQVFPGWWRRDGEFLLTTAGLEQTDAPVRLAGGAELATARPMHSWVANPVVSP